MSYGSDSESDSPRTPPPSPLYPFLQPETPRTARMMDPLCQTISTGLTIQDVEDTIPEDQPFIVPISQVVQPKKDLVLTEQSFVLADVKTGRVDLDRMIEMMKTGTPVISSTDNKVMLVIVNLHGAIVVNATAATHASPYPKENAVQAAAAAAATGTTGYKYTMTSDVETDPRVLHSIAEKAGIPEGMHVFEVRVTTQNLTLHKNFTLDTTAQVFKRLKRRARLLGSPLTANDLFTYATIIAQSIRSQHENEKKATSMPLPDLSVAPYSVHSNVVQESGTVDQGFTLEKDPAVYESFFYADTALQDVGKSIGFFPLFQDPKVSCKSSDLHSNQAIITSTSDIISIAHKRGATTVIIMNGACAVKRTTEEVDKMIRLAIEDAGNLETLTEQHKLNPSLRKILRRYTSQHHDAAASLSQDPSSPPGGFLGSFEPKPGGKRYSKRKRKRSQRSHRKRSKRKIS
jgi:hypothetical protein